VPERVSSAVLYPCVMEDDLLILVCSGLAGALVAVQGAWLLFHQVDVAKFNAAVTRVCDEGQRDKALRLCQAAPNSSYVGVVKAILEEAGRSTPADAQARLRSVLQRTRAWQLQKMKSMRWNAPLALALACVVPLLASAREPMPLEFLGVSGVIVILAAATWRSRVRFERSFDAADALVPVIASTVSPDEQPSERPSDTCDETSDENTIEGAPLFELNKNGVASLMLAQAAIFFFGGLAFMVNGRYMGLIGPMMSPVMLWLWRWIGSSRLVFTSTGIYVIRGQGFTHTPFVAASAAWPTIQSVELVVKQHKGSDRTTTSYTLVFERHDGKAIRYLVGWPPSRKERAALTGLCEERNIAIQL
jgi:hypothetical protein